MNSKSCFILGLPEAGKSTYLAALMHLLQDTDIKTKLELTKYIGDHTYLKKLKQSWLAFKRVSRTSAEMQKKSLSILVHDQTQKEFHVTFPDLSGEVFQKLYRDREINNELVDCIKNSNGIFFFINPSKIIEPVLISIIREELRTNAETDSPSVEIDSEKLDVTEVQLVELLQFIDYLKNEYKIPVVIAISAWDVAKKICSTPGMFVKKRTPLLWQYLRSNSNKFDVKYYGISAQGGALDSDSKAKKLAEKFESKSAAERVLVVDNEGNSSHDITLPLWEAMNN